MYNLNSSFNINKNNISVCVHECMCRVHIMYGCVCVCVYTSACVGCILCMDVCVCVWVCVWVCVCVCGCVCVGGWLGVLRRVSELLVLALL